MWVIDICHWLNEQKDGPAVPQLKLKVKKLACNPLFDTTHYVLFDLRIHLPDVFTLTFPWLLYIHLVETNRIF